jgi:hypothetical protein
VKLKRRCSVCGRLVSLTDRARQLNAKRQKVLGAVHRLEEQAGTAEGEAFAKLEKELVEATRELQGIEGMLRRLGVL